MTCLECIGPWVQFSSPKEKRDDFGRHQRKIYRGSFAFSYQEFHHMVYYFSFSTTLCLLQHCVASCKPKGEMCRINSKL